MEAGRFRQDLVYRPSVFPLVIPPLRERREDIPRLVQHFAAQSARRLNRPVPRISQAEMAALTAYGWPGNVRELQNLVERAIIVWQGGPLRFPVDVPPRLADAAPAAETGAPPPMLTRDELKRLERASIVRALEQTNGKVSGPGGAAELLGLRPTTLSSRIAALGLKRAKSGRDFASRPPSSILPA